MSEEEKAAIEYLGMYAGDEENRVYEGECTYNIELLLNYIDKLQKENENYKELILVIKEKLNNIQFEVEQTWRKIEKLENKDE